LLFAFEAIRRKRDEREVADRDPLCSKLNVGLAGVIVDGTNKKPIVNATVMFATDKTGSQTLTDENGKFLFANVPKDTKDIYLTISKTGYKTITMNTEMTRTIYIEMERELQP
jgi:hypothetical protein